ncbi:MAG TPA: hypothetical protein VIT45_09575 [Allosphingosinicella sp.]
MSDQGEEAAPHVPSDEALRLLMAQTMEQMFLHSKASTGIILELQERLTAVEAVLPDEREVELERVVTAQKDVLTHMFEKFKQYTTVIIAGAFAAYFTTLGVLSDRFSDGELLLSALLMTTSLFVFVMWEVTGIIWMGIHTIRGDHLEKLQGPPRWQEVGWALAMTFSLLTAVPAVGISVWVYLRRLGALEWLGSWF